eukprot:CAMPEP_0113698554 /NCGR_PEP_ID=MMETSP0038_2-20120614/22777_1 /TAXON_ID=2898 /ORGANISM="Cryptomonas paramecium" /LENGTH=37 /DNA_ID=CAMNT_0000621735 /DNA_START=406 /DNA_END=516 /DNA_ORIENTATION=- /assembly_acc=CAM_ASM_000170
MTQSQAGPNAPPAGRLGLRDEGDRRPRRREPGRDTAP